MSRDTTVTGGTACWVFLLAFLLNLIVVGLLSWAATAVLHAWGVNASYWLVFVTVIVLRLLFGRGGSR